MRDYLYIPLGGNRGGKLLTHSNLMLTMLLGGLWHGAAWTFVVWGGMHGLALIVHKEYLERLAGFEAIRIIGQLTGHVLTLYWVLVGWIFFRATSFGDAVPMLKAFLFCGAEGEKHLDPRLLYAVIPMAFVHWIARRKLIAPAVSKAPDWVFAAGLAVAIVLVLPFTSFDYKPFIYFQF